MFIEPNFTSIEPIFKKLHKDSMPLWGSMCAQRMLEHLVDNLEMAMAKKNYSLSIPEDRIPRMQDFLWSEKPMAKNIKVAFAPEKYTLRNGSFDEAKEELYATWKAYENHFKEHPKATSIHPFYGALNKNLWDRLIAKHFTHHFDQFGLL